MLCSTCTSGSWVALQGARCTYGIKRRYCTDKAHKSFTMITGNSSCSVASDTSTTKWGIIRDMLKRNSGDNGTYGIFVGSRMGQATKRIHFVCIKRHNKFNKRKTHFTRPVAHGTQHTALLVDVDGWVQTESGREGQGDRKSDSAVLPWLPSCSAFSPGLSLGPACYRIWCFTAAFVVLLFFALFIETANRYQIPDNKTVSLAASKVSDFISRLLVFSKCEFRTCARSIWFHNLQKYVKINRITTLLRQRNLLIGLA